jgi:ribosomal protein S18 acetylase RimI-like enzyme
MTAEAARAGVGVVRRLTADDAPAMADLATVCEIAETGEPDPEIVDWILVGAKREKFYAFGIDDASGLAAFSYADCETGHVAFEAEVRVRPGKDLDLGLPLLQAARGAARVVDPAKPVHMFANEGAEAYRRWLQSQGAVEIRRFWRMTIDLDDTPPSVPEPPAGVSVRLARDDEDDLRSIFTITDTSFADHFGHTDERTYDKWIEHWRDRRGFDPSLWSVAELDGQPVAVLLGMTFDVEGGRTYGHIGTLGTLKEARGKGIGTLLLRTAFAEFHNRGYRKVTLGVDSENGTGAVKLYKSVGMHEAAVWPLYELPPLRGGAPG